MCGKPVMGEKRAIDGKLLLKKCGMRVDRISALPEDIIVKILSFLPLNEAAASTSLVSKRWSHLWKYSPKLIFSFEFGYDDEGVSNNINRVNLALKLHKALSLQEFKIQFYVDRPNQHHVAKWLEYAFSRRVERLELNLRGPEILNDRGVCVVLDQDILKEIVGSSSFKSLKVLCLRFCQVSGDAIGFFLRNCESLERLVIYRVKRRSDLEIVGPSLKHLHMRSRVVLNKYRDYATHPYFREDYSIKIGAPNLTWLTIDQNSNVLFLENVPKLVNINFYCRSQLGDSMHHFDNVAAQLVTLIVHLFEPEVTFSVPEMPKLKKLVVYFRSNFHVAPVPLTRFLSASPCLEEFKLEISELYVGEGNSAFGVGPPCPHRHLKLFVLSGYCGVTSYRSLDFRGLAVSLDLVRYMVDNCVGLEEIVVGQCDRVGLVRNIVGDSYDPLELEDVILEPEYPHSRHEATPQEQEAFRNTIQLQQIPAHIKVRIVFEDTIRH